MDIEFKKVSDFERGTLYKLLKDAYSFDCRYEKKDSLNWQEFDNFFFDNLQIADRCGFITTIKDKAIGFVSWNPTKMPEYVEIGHNCIATKYKNKGYGKMQLQEAINRIIKNDVNKIVVTTDDDLIPAQRMYESVGFIIDKRKNENNIDFVNEFIDYIMQINNKQK
jgi:ribosomal protein S18 acetylase RimI-like enzyme